MSLPLHLRNYKEKSKDETTRDFFNVPYLESLGILGESSGSKDAHGGGVGAVGSGVEGLQGMDINAVLSVEGKEEVYVSQSISMASDQWKPQRRNQRAHVRCRLGSCLCYRLSSASFLWTDGLVDVPCHCIQSEESRGESFSSWHRLRLSPGLMHVCRLNSRAGVFALSLATWHGMRIVRGYLSDALLQLTSTPQILQLTSLLPTAEHFSILLRDALKAQVGLLLALTPQTLTDDICNSSQP